MTSRKRARPILETLEGRHLLSGSGSLDPTFANGGYVVNGTGGTVAEPANFGGGPNSGNLVAVQPWDGKSVMVSQFVARYNTNGTLDTTFGSGGTVSFNLSGYSIHAITFDTTAHKIVLAGTEGMQDLVIRLNSNGSLDSTFGSRGEALVTIAGEKNGVYASAVAVDSSGRVVVAGSATGSYNWNLYSYMNYDTVFRLTGAGKLDNTFGKGGEVNGTPNPNYDGWSALQVEPDNSVVLVGMDNNQPVIAHDSATGVRESRNILRVPNNPFAPSQSVGLGTIAFEPNGQVVSMENISGQARNGVIALQRYNTDGTQDAGFGTNGTVIFDVSATLGQTVSQNGNGLVIDPLGRIIVGGALSGPTGPDDQLLARFTTTGAPDLTFGQGGASVTALGSYSSCVENLALQPDGNIMTVGYIGVGVNPSRKTEGYFELVVARYLAT